MASEHGVKFGEHPLVCRFMKGVFELRPALPNYTEVWDVKVVLDYINAFKPLETIKLKELTLKLSMLLCLLTRQRCQTIHNINIDYMKEMETGYRITIRENLKQTRVGKHLEPIELLRFREDPQLCVIEHLQEYLKRAKDVRFDNKQLFLSYTKPYKPVSKDTIA